MCPICPSLDFNQQPLFTIKKVFSIVSVKCLSVPYKKCLSVPYIKCLSVPYIKCLSVPRNFLWLIVSVANTPSLLGRRKPSKEAGRRPANQRVKSKIGLFPFYGQFDCNLVNEYILCIFKLTMH